MTFIRNTLLASATLAATSFNANAVEVCHIANAGALIKGANASVLIDGLIREDQYDGQFHLPSPAMQKAMFEKTGLFENLKLVITTHRHGDHFDAMATRQHMDETNDVQYVMPAEAVDAVKALNPSPEHMTRIRSVPDDTQIEWTIDDIRVEAYDVFHGPNQPHNTGYRITIDGKRFFHTGDISASREQLEAAGINELEVDGLLIVFWYGMDEVRKAAMAESWNAKTILPNHFGAKPAPWMEQFGGPEGVQDMVENSYPNAVVHRREGECTDF